MTDRLISETGTEADDISIQAMPLSQCDSHEVEPTAIPSAMEALPSPAEIALRAAEIRSEWSLKLRATNRVDPERADITDQLEGFQWPEEIGEVEEPRKQVRGRGARIYSTRRLCRTSRTRAGQSAPSAIQRKHHE